MWHSGDSAAAYFLAKIRKPSIRFNVLDTVDYIVDHYSADPVSNYWAKGETAGCGVASRHQSSKVVNVNFFDGHVESRTWQTLLLANTKGWDVYGAKE